MTTLESIAVLVSIALFVLLMVLALLWITRTRSTETPEKLPTTNNDLGQSMHDD